MSQNYYDSTGFLVLDRVTPVIEAIFGEMNLEPIDPTRRRAFIATASECDGPSWTDIFAKLAAVAASLGASLPGSASRIDILDAIAGRLNSTLDDRAQLAETVQDGDECPSPAKLFIVASQLNDGHGLSAIQMEGAWHSDRLLPNHFGGIGFYMSNEVCVQFTSNDAQALGPPVRAALANHDVETAAAHFTFFTEDLLLGITEEETRNCVRAILSHHLSSPPVLLPKNVQ